eukprot:6119719-Amphidinium_carterae.1
MELKATVSVGIAHFAVLVSAGALALERQSFLRRTWPKEVSGNVSKIHPSREETLPSPCFDRLVTELFHNSTDQPVGAVVEVEKRQKIVCYIKSVIDPSRIGSLTKP